MRAEFNPTVKGPFGKVDATTLERPTVPVDPSTLEAAADTLERFRKDTLNIDPTQAAIDRSKMLHPAFSSLAPLVVYNAQFLVSAGNDIDGVVKSAPDTASMSDATYEDGAARKRALKSAGVRFVETDNKGIVLRRPRRQMRPFH
jgi:hypothetical protein